jgi:DNA replication protein DnaC
MVDWDSVLEKVAGGPRIAAATPVDRDHENRLSRLRSEVRDERSTAVWKRAVRGGRTPEQVAADEALLAEFEAESARQDEQERRSKLRAKIAGLGMPITASDVELLVEDKLQDTKCLQSVRAWLGAARTKPWLVLSGTVGRGKTMAAAWVLTKHNGLYVGARELERVFAARYGDEVEGQRTYTDCGGLVIDDVGRERDADGMSAALLDLVDYRRGQRQSTILITNFSRKQFSERYPDERLQSRLSECALWIADAGPDLRRQP